MDFRLALTLLFIGLKLTGHIVWSWVWVLSPLWLELALIIAALASVLAIAGIAFFIVCIAACIKIFYKMLIDISRT